MNIDFQKIRAEAAQYKLSGRELLEERTDEPTPTEDGE